MFGGEHCIPGYPERQNEVFDIDIGPLHQIVTRFIELHNRIAQRLRAAAAQPGLVKGLPSGLKHARKVRVGGGVRGMDETGS